jgi:murein L,D-transpeptidase YafK
MDYFKHLSNNHLLLVVIFENAEVKAFSKANVQTLEEIYVKTIAEKFVYEKKLIVREFKKHGILSILTKPQDLSTNLINKYLEIKTMGKI